MTVHELNITFKNQEECKKWEDENLKDNKYQGQTIMMVMHDEVIGSDEVKLTEIITV